MSVAIAITVTLPATTAAAVVATGTDIAQSIGPEVIRLVQDQIDSKVQRSQQGIPTVSATVT